MTEIIGYVASIIVILSFLMKNIIKLRIITSVGCLLFVVYGVLINYSIPVILTNSVIAVINVYFLIQYRIKNGKEKK